MIVMLDYSDSLPRSAHMFSMAIAHLNSSLNPLLYAMTNPLFQKGYGLFIRKLLCKVDVLDMKSITKEFHSSINQIKTANWCC